MITVAAAKILLGQHTTPMPAKPLPLRDAAGLVLAADIFAPQDIPAFRQSAMDGYAFAFNNWSGQPLPITATIPAGHTTPTTLAAGKAARIFTGAPMPDDADTVVIQEKTEVTAATLHIQDAIIKAGANVRPIGSEARKGALALVAGTRLTPASIGFLATLGLEEVPVHTRPRIQVIVTGNELQTPGHPLEHGQVYEANSYTLCAALAQLQLHNIPVHHAPDHAQQLQAIIAKALDATDLLLLTGGVSVGDYDYVAQALADCGVETLFHKVAQKPGKPLFAGRLKDKLVFGLPGNPSSVLTCFYEYVLPVIEQKMGIPHSSVQAQTLVLRNAYQKAAGLTHFLKGQCDAGGVTLLTGQESYKLHSFAVANCLVQLDADQTSFAAGDPVIIHRLPF